MGKSRGSIGAVAPIVAALGVALAGCGGGGGGGSSAPNPPPPPAAGSFTLDRDVISFTTDNQTVTPSPQIIVATVTGVTAATLFFRVEVAGEAVANVNDIVVTSATTGQASVVPTPATQLGPGTYTSTITVYACTSSPTCATQQLSGSPRTVNVTYTITGIGTSESSLAYAIGPAPTDADKTRKLAVTGHPNDLPWTAAAPAPWVQLTPTNGDTSTANELTVTIDTDLLGARENGTYHTEVTVTPSIGAAVTVPVALTLERTQVDYVAPYVDVGGVSRDVIVRGVGFDPAMITGVAFGGLVSFDPPEVLSATEIRVRQPALGPGKHTVTLAGPAAAALSKAEVAVVGVHQYPPATLQRAFGVANERPTGIVYDAERQRLYVLIDRPPSAPDALIQYSFNAASSTWNESQIILGQDTKHALALAIDGASLLLATTDSVSRAVLRSWPLGPTAYDYEYAYSLGGSAYLRSLAVTNDGDAVLVSADGPGTPRAAYLVPTRRPIGGPTTPALVALEAAGTGSDLFFDGVAAASLDGSRVLIASSTSGPGGPRVYEYDASTGELTDTGVALGASGMQLDRTGDRVLLGTTLYDRNFVPIGALPDDTLAAVLSADGSRVYTYSHDGTNGLGRLFVVGPGTLTLASSWTTNGSAGDPQLGTVMTVTLDGLTLFIAGSDAVLVEPPQ